MSQAKVLVVGSSNVDMTVYLERVPAAGETLSGNSFTIGFGGKGANQAVAAARFGGGVAFVNCVGSDEFGEMTLTNLGSEGIDTGFVSSVHGATGVASIWVEADGSNRIIVVPGANHQLRPEDARRAVAESAHAKVVVGQFEVPQQVTAAAFSEAKARGMTTVLNPAPYQAVSAELLAVTDWLLPNEVEFAGLYKSVPGLSGHELGVEAMIAETAQALGCRLLVTLGAEGAALVSASGKVTQLLAPETSAVDTVGAGDCFVGAFAHGLAAGLSDEQAARLGIIAASLSVKRLGAQSSYPSAAEAARLFAEVSP